MAVAMVQGAGLGHERRGGPQYRGQGLKGMTGEDRGLEQWGTRGLHGTRITGGN